MNIIQENIDEVNAVLKVKVVEDDYLPKVESILKDYQKKAKIAGFRPGKVPTGVIKKMYGKSIIVDEINKLLSDSLSNYLNENKIEVLGNPLPKLGSQNTIDWDNQKDFEFLYDMALAPKFNVELSPKDNFVYQTVKTDESLINKYVTDLTRRYGKVEQVEVSQEGDLINGDFVELDNYGEILAGGIFKSGSIFIDKIKEEQTKKSLVGIKKEDKVIVEAKNLSDSRVDLATMLGIDRAVAESLQSKFQYTIKAITRIVPADMNQEFFDKIYGPGNVTNEEQFRTKIKDELASMFVNDSERKFYNDVVEHLMNKVNFNLPTEFLKRWIAVANEKPITPEEVEKEFESYAQGMKWQLIENKIIKDNDIKVTNDELMDEVKGLIIDQYSRMGQMPDEEEINRNMKMVLENEKEIKRIYDNMYGQKVMTILKTKFTLENKEVDYDESLMSKNKSNFASQFNKKTNQLKL